MEKWKLKNERDKKKCTKVYFIIMRVGILIDMMKLSVRERRLGGMPWNDCLASRTFTLTFFHRACTNAVL